MLYATVCSLPHTNWHGQRGTHQDYIQVAMITLTAALPHTSLLVQQEGLARTCTTHTAQASQPPM